MGLWQTERLHLSLRISQNLLEQTDLPRIQCKHGPFESLLLATPEVCVCVCMCVPGALFTHSLVTSEPILGRWSHLPRVRVRTWLRIQGPQPQAWPLNTKKSCPLTCHPLALSVLKQGSWDGAQPGSRSLECSRHSAPVSPKAGGVTVTQVSGPWSVCPAQQAGLPGPFLLPCQ